ncbi:MAG: beta-ketoacyl-ACP synthase III [candidate division Zixibacteria bacterium]|nr:beta-ketoacyl-ACP synthase III [candidate division Zixibacteria bacterium]
MIGTGRAVPPKILTNYDLEKIVDTTDEWIVTRTGIKERHIADENTTASTLATEAALTALNRADVKPDDLDLILVATVTPDMPFPSTAAIIQSKIGAKKAAVMDVAAGCTGFIYGLSIVDSYIKSGTFKKILLIGVEVLSKITDWQDRSTCVLFGDGAGAVVIEASKERTGIMGTYIRADGSHGDLLKMPGGGSKFPASQSSVDQRLHFLKMSGNEVFKVAVRAMNEASQTILSKTGIKADEIGMLVPHQANVRIIRATAERLKIPPEKVYINIDRYGNTSSASIPIALDEIRNNGHYEKANPLLLVAFGAGFTWGSAAITW